MRREVSEYVGGSPTPLEIMIATIAAVRAEERAAQATQIAALREALERVERWFGEFPETGQFWDKEKSQPMSYAACWGSNGERDFMRTIARAALGGWSDNVAKRPHPS